MYIWEGMNKITFEEALKLFKENSTDIYLLYEDDTEGQVNTESELIDHYDRGGEFGVEKRDHKLLKEKKYSNRIGCISASSVDEETLLKLAKKCGVEHILEKLTNKK